MRRIPAFLLASVSANIPSFPVTLSLFVLMVMLPPSPVLVEPVKTVVLALAPSPMSMVLASMVILPAFPVPSVLARILLLLVSSMFSLVSKVIWPALPWELVVLMMSVLSSVMLPRL